MKLLKILNIINQLLVNKVNNIDTSGFVLKTRYDTDKLELEKNS